MYSVLSDHPSRVSSTVGVSVNEDGSYKGTWTPLNPGEYKLHLRLDGKKAGKEVDLSVNPLKVEEEPAVLDDKADKKEMKVEVIKIKVCRCVYGHHICM